MKRTSLFLDAKLLRDLKRAADRRRVSVASFVRSLANGELVVEQLEAEDIVRAEVLLRRYADLEVGFVDATVIATAERLDAAEILTTDRRHFSAIRPAHVGTFRLSP